MDKISSLCAAIGLLCSPFFFSACDRMLSDDDDRKEGAAFTLPLKLVGSIQEITTSRVSNNRFEQGDSVGLFALSGGSSLTEERYLDNLKFVRSAAGEFLSQESVYFPDNGSNLNLISYYPYQPQGVTSGRCTLPVSVSASQQVVEEYAKSDFLVASKMDVSPSKKAIPMVYQHQFFRLKVSIIAGGVENAKQLLAAHPTIEVHGFYTKATYDFDQKTFTAFADEKDMVPAGDWALDGDRLVGKDVILIPQPTTEGYQYIMLKVGDKSYISKLPSRLQLAAGKQRQLEITFVANEDVLMAQLAGEISDWQGREMDTIQSAIVHKYVDVTKLDFNQSSVYKLIHGGKQVGQICKEYLVTPDFSSQAIVAYPMTKDEKVDLKRGMVVQLIGETNEVHGGKVSWDLRNNSLTYVPGKMAARKRVYVLEDGTVALSISHSSKVVPVLPMADELRDVRGAVVRHYPLVKIGTQYWMRSNLEAERMMDGSVVEKMDSTVADKAGFMVDGAHHYYMARLALADNFLPADWRIPNWADWQRLDAYLMKNMSVVKSGHWLPLTAEKAVPVSNLSGFGAEAVGFYVGKIKLNDKYVAYWTLDDSGKQMSDSVFYLIGDANISQKAVSGVERKAFPIRCIRK